MRGNCNPHTLMVGTYNCMATVENSLAIPQIIKHTVTTYPSKSTSRVKTYTHTRTCTPMFTTTLFIKSKKSENPNVHPLTVDKQNVVHPNSGIYDHKKE